MVFEFKLFFCLVASYVFIMQGVSSVMLDFDLLIF